MAPDPELTEFASLAADLGVLGRPLRRAELDEALVAGVLERAAAPARSPAGAGARWRAIVDRARAFVTGRPRRALVGVVIAVLVAVLGAADPVRAQVAQWFGFAGVKVRVTGEGGPTPSSVPLPTGGSGGVSLERARGLVPFALVGVPGLGRPDRVEVSPDRRVVSLTWVDGAGRATRLDEFADRLDYAFAKTASAVQWVEVGDGQGLWFDRPHEVVLLDPAGRPRTETARLAGRTLIWERAGVTLRLEGSFSRDRAVELAAGARPLAP